MEKGRQGRLEALMAEKSGMKKVTLGTRKALGEKGLLDLARRYSEKKYGKGRGTILTLCGQKGPGFREISADLAAVEGASGHDVCALLLATCPAPNPHLPPPYHTFTTTLSTLCTGFTPHLPPQNRFCTPYGPEFARDMAILCAERDWLLLLDEEKTAFGCHGVLFGYQTLGVLPDGAVFDGGVLIGDKLAAVMGEEAWMEQALSREGCLELLCRMVEHHT